MTNWQVRKHASLTALQNGAAKHSLQRSAAVNMLRSGNSNNILRIRVRHLCRCDRTSALAVVLDTTIITTMATLEIMGAKVFLAIRFLGGIERILKQILKVHKSLTFPTKKRGLTLHALSRSLRITTRGIRPRISSLPTNTINVVEQMLALITVRSATHF